MSELEDSADPRHTAASTSTSAPEQRPTQQDDDVVPWTRKDFKEILESLDCIEIVLATRPTKYDFRDDELMNRPGIRLDRYTDDEIAKLGRKVMPMASSVFSQEGAAAILVLAYQLRSPRTGFKHYVFTDGDRYTTTSDEKYDDYSDEVMTALVQAEGPAKPISITPITINDSAKEAAVYSYIAASMLRLFAKPAANYVKSWNRIIEGFPKFYGKSVDMFTMRALLPTLPNEESMAGLANWFDSSATGAKATLYRLLHMSNSNQEHAGMKWFLYDMHLSYTGLHAVHMLFEICKVLSCSPSEVVAAINNTRERELQLTCLTHVLELHADDGEKHKRRMWRYGRLFDSGFMAELQTKTCRTLVYTFAEALRSEAPEDYSGMLEITELARVSDFEKERCAAEAQQLLRTIKASKT